MSTNNLFAAEHNGDFWLICTSQGEFIIIQENSDEFDDLIYFTSTTSPIKRLMQLHDILKTLFHNNELAQCLNNFVKDAQFI